MTRTQELNELRHRVEAKRKKLETEIEVAKADAAGKAGETLDALRSKLEQVDERLRDGWESLTDETIAQLNNWLKEDDG